MTISPAEFRLDERTFGFFRSIAKSKGIPTDLLEDCAQEMAVAAWQAPDHWGIAARREATDFFRRHVLTRSGHELATFELLPEHLHSPEPEIHIDELQALNALTINERALLERRLAMGLHAPAGQRTMTNREEWVLCAGRKILRLVLAGELIAPDRPYNCRVRCSCGVIFWTDRGTKRYCDNRCRARFWKRRLRRLKPLPRTMARLHRMCETCGTRLTASRSSSLTRKRFCNQNCRARHDRAQRRLALCA